LELTSARTKLNSRRRNSQVSKRRKMHEQPTNCHIH